METLIKITEQNNAQVVSARELHTFLVVQSEQNEIGEKYADWIKRMLDYGFVENQDYIISEYDYTGAEIRKSDNQTVRVHKREYALTIDTAKEISMIQRNDKGKQARQYFIEFEKRAKNQTPLEMLKIAVNELEQKEEQIRLQSRELKQSAPKVEYFDAVLQSNSTYTTNQIAKELGMSAIGLNKELHDLSIQYKQSDTWLLYSKYQDQGYSKTKTHQYFDSLGKQQTAMQTVWTEKGRMFIHACLDIDSRKASLQKQLKTLNKAS